MLRKPETGRFLPGTRKQDTPLKQVESERPRSLRSVWPIVDHQAELSSARIGTSINGG